MLKGDITWSAFIIEMMTENVSGHAEFDQDYALRILHYEL